MRTRLTSAALVLAASAFPSSLPAAEGNPAALALATREVADAAALEPPAP